MSEKKVEEPNGIRLKKVVQDYKRGSLSLSEASNEIEVFSGLTADIVACFLKSMQRSNVIKLSSEVR